MVYTTVAPAWLPTRGQPGRLRAPGQLLGQGAPPMSLARMVPANMAGSAPKTRYTGTTTGRRSPASTGARLMMPTMSKSQEA